jgi:hypothetical protein
MRAGERTHFEALLGDLSTEKENQENDRGAKKRPNEIYMNERSILVRLRTNKTCGQQTLYI